jgi:DNA-binding XRE family transcriptional regulator
VARKYKLPSGTWVEREMMQSQAFINLKGFAPQLLILILAKRYFELQLNQHELAKLIGCDRSLIAKIETGAVQLTSSWQRALFPSSIRAVLTSKIRLSILYQKNGDYGISILFLKCVKKTNSIEVSGIEKNKTRIRKRNHIHIRKRNHRVCFRAT